MLSRLRQIIFDTYWYHPRKSDLVYSIHHSYVRGWPKNPTLVLDFIPMKIRVYTSRIPLLRSRYIDYIIYCNDYVGTVPVGTYINTNFHKLDGPQFIRVYPTQQP